MNTPRSREGNVIRYAVYLAGYVAVFAVVKLVTRKSPVHIWDLILFGLVAAMILLFYVYRFNREQRFLPVIINFHGWAVCQLLFY